MKIKNCMIGALSLGLAAGLVRIIQYCTVIDQDGFFIEGNLASLLNGCLVGLLGIGVVWSLLCSLKQKAQISFTALYSRGAADLLFFGLAAVAAAEGAFRLYTAFRSLPIDTIGVLVGALCLLSALGWFFLSKRTETPLAFFPILHLCASIIDYFWATYQYIHVSGYILMVLGLCTLVLFTTSLMKAVTGATCSRGRMIGFSALAICSIPAAFAEALFNLTLPNLILALQGLFIFALALLTLFYLSKPTPEPEPEAEAPDLSELNQYFSEIPEEEQENEQDR